MVIKDYTTQLAELDTMTQPNTRLDQMVAEYLFNYHCPNMVLYSQDRNHIDEIEDAIENLGIGNNYADELIELICPNTAIFDTAIETCNDNCGGYGDSPSGYDVVLRVLRATPYERCIAALRAYFKSDGGKKLYAGW